MKMSRRQTYRRWQTGAYLILSVSGGFLLPNDVLAQNKARIVDSDQRPLPDVTVELWGGSTQLYSQRTDSAGFFYFRPGGSTPSGLIARKLGYRSVNAKLTGLSSDMIFVMERVSLPLPTVVARAVTSQCPNVETSDARQLWKNASKRYERPAYGRYLEIWADVKEGEVSRSEVGAYDSGFLTPSGIGVGAGQRLADSARVTDSGYAYPVYILRRSASRWASKTVLRWVYPHLEAWIPQHFLEPEFGATQTFSIVRRDSDNTLIAFCSKRRNVPSISGLLTFGRDTTLLRAEWEFEVDSKRSDAGGEVVFLPVEGPGQLLIPLESTIWRRADDSTERYFRAFTTYHRWILH